MRKEDDAPKCMPRRDSFSFGEEEGGWGLGQGVGRLTTKRNLEKGGEYRKDACKTPLNKVDAGLGSSSSGR